MKKISFIILAIILTFGSCDEEETGIPKPNNFSASDGTAVGSVYIDFTLSENSESVEVYRREKGGSEYDWQLIKGAGGPFFDQEGYWGGTGMPQGKVFEYRMRSCCGDQNEYTEIDEGYAYVIIPVTSIEITSSQSSNLLIWNEGNNEGFLNNNVEIRFDIYRSEEPDGTFTKIGTSDHDRSYRDDLQNYPELQGKTLYYKINTWFYPFELTFAEGTVVELEGTSGENTVIEYNSSNIGQVASSSSGNIHRIREKVIDNSIFIGVIKEANAAAYGKPALFKLTGNIWQELWTSIPDVEYDEINFAVSGSNSFLAGTGGVYKWNGSVWSDNLTPDNLGQAEAPSDVAIEVYNDELYMAIEQYPDYSLQVLKYTGSNWDTIGGDISGIIASGNVFDSEIENIDGTLYLYYRIDDTFYIKHLNGTIWTTDLEWTQEWLGYVELAKDGSEIYFSADTRSSSYKGGIYHVVNASTVENLIPDDSDWFTLGAYTLAIDSDGNIIVSSVKYESPETIYPYLNLYDGTEWLTISGDFSDGIRPVGLSTIGTDIYYIYGDGSTEDAVGYPTALKSLKMSQ